MPNTYSWQFLTLESRLAEAGLQDVVKRVVCLLKADNGDGVIVDQLLNLQIGAVDPMAFTEFADLTAIEVQGWVEAALGAPSIASWQAVLDAKIDELTQNRALSPPWVT
jgi:hypothetical protein